MKLKRYARKRRQFNFILKKIERLEQTNWKSYSENSKSKLIYKAKKLFYFFKSQLSQARLRKALGILGMVAGMLTPMMVNAQETEYAESVRDAFGMNRIGAYQHNVYVDLDNDGDLDILSQAYDEDGVLDGSQFYFVENLGDENNPDFGDPAENPFNINAGYVYVGFHTLVDIDDDGDLDVFMSRQIELDTLDNYQNVLSFMENVGTAELPDFAEPVINPFEIELIEGEDIMLGVSHADLDNDGDYDLMVTQLLYSNYDYLANEFFYFENIGDAQNPSFDEFEMEPFGLEINGGFLIGGSFVDFDKDGDLDVVGSLYAYYSSGNVFFENIGNESNPGFTSPEIDPAGLENSVPVFSIGFGDLDGDGDLDAVTTPFEELARTEYFENLCIVSDVEDLSSDFVITMSPNPASNQVNINIKGENNTLKVLEVYDLLGANVLSEQIGNTHFNLDISSLTSGQYFIN